MPKMGVEKLSKESDATKDGPKTDGECVSDGGRVRDKQWCKKSGFKQSRGQILRWVSYGAPRLQRGGPHYKPLYYWAFKKRILRGTRRLVTDL